MTAEQRGDVLAHIDARPKLQDLDVQLAIEAATEHLDLEARLFRAWTTTRRRRPCWQQHVVDLDHAARRGDVAARAGHRHALHQPRAGDEARRDDPRHRDVGCDVRLGAISRRALGKTPVEVRDFPGFVSNRVLMPMINEAVYALYEGVGSVEAIDTVMKLGMNHPMGPLTLADFIGLDTCWRS